MPRLGKKTLYLDLEALSKLQAALSRLPGGGPSLSSYLNEVLPTLADALTEMVDNAQKGGLRGLADMLEAASKYSARVADGLEADIAETIELEAKKAAPKTRASIPPRKRRKPAAKKVVTT
jgi:hypothetical protein